jgi:hypothetical protein
MQLDGPGTGFVLFGNPSYGGTKLVYRGVDCFDGGVFAVRAVAAARQIRSR